jgi:hypothetical protein
MSMSRSTAFDRAALSAAVDTSERQKTQARAVSVRGGHVFSRSDP